MELRYKLQQQQSRWLGWVLLAVALAVWLPCAAAAPGALSVTAHDTGHQPGIGPGDSIIIVFDIDTNQPDINTTVGFNTLLEFNTLMPQPLAFWQNASTLIITIQSIEGVDRVATRTNHLRIEIKKDGNLRDWQEFSSQTDIVVIVSGDWGPMEAPRVVSLLAMDAPCDASPGFSTQDVLQLTFNLPTHQPPMPNSSRVDAYLFTNVDATSNPVSPLGSGYHGEWQDAYTLNIIIGNVAGVDNRETAVNRLSFNVASGFVKSEDQSSGISRWALPLINGTWGRQAPPVLLSAIAADAGEPGLSAGDTLTLTFDVLTTEPFIVPPATEAFDWSSNVGPVSAVWTARNILVLELTAPDVDRGLGGTVSADATRIGRLTISVLAAANVRTDDMDSDPAASPPIFVSGTWGAHSALIPIAAYADDTGHAPGVGLGDSIIVRLNAPSAMPSMFDCGGGPCFEVALAGARVLQVWESRFVARLTVVELPQQDRHLIEWEASVGRLKVRVAADKATTLLTEDRSSGSDPTVHAVLAGSWGNATAPPIVSCWIDGETGSQPGLDDADTITIVLAEPSTKPNVDRFAVLDEVHFSIPSMGIRSFGTWLDNSTLQYIIDRYDETDLTPTSASAGAAEVADALGRAREARAASAHSLIIGLPPGNTMGAFDGSDPIRKVWSYCPSPLSGSFSAQVHELQVRVRVDAYSASYLDARRSAVSRAARDMLIRAGVDMPDTPGVESQAVIDSIIELPRDQAAAAGLSQPGLEQVLLQRDGVPVGTMSTQGDCGGAHIVGSIGNPGQVVPLEGYVVRIEVRVPQSPPGNATSEMRLRTIANVLSEAADPALGAENQLSTRFAELDLGMTGVLHTIADGETRVAGGSVQDTYTPVLFLLNRQPAGPIITGASAQNSGVTPGLSDGDTLCVLFSQLTNMGGGREVQVAVHNSAYNLGSGQERSVSLALGGDTSPSIRLAADAATIVAALEAVRYINVGGVHVEVTTVAGEVSWWITFTADCRLCTGDVPLMTASPAEAMELREVQAGNRLTHHDVVTGIRFSAALGSHYSGLWVSPSQLCITVEHVSPSATVADTRPTVLMVAVLPEAGIRAAHLDSLPADDSARVGGSWGKARAPVLIVARSVNGDGNAYIGIGDQLLLRFDARTNRFPLNTEELVDRALRLEPPAFTGQAKFTGVWLNHTAAELTVTWVSPTFDNGWFSDPGGFSVQMQSGVTSEDFSSNDAATRLEVEGVFGEPAIPWIFIGVIAGLSLLCLCCTCLWFRVPWGNATRNCVKCTSWRRKRKLKRMPTAVYARATGLDFGTHSIKMAWCDPGKGRFGSWAGTPLEYTITASWPLQVSGFTPKATNRSELTVQLMQRRQKSQKRLALVAADGGDGGGAGTEETPARKHWDSAVGTAAEERIAEGGRRLKIYPFLKRLLLMRDYDPETMPWSRLSALSYVPARDQSARARHAQGMLTLWRHLRRHPDLHCDPSMPLVVAVPSSFLFQHKRDLADIMDQAGFRGGCEFVSEASAFMLALYAATPEMELPPPIPRHLAHTSSPWNRVSTLLFDIGAGFTNLSYVAVDRACRTVELRASTSLPVGYADLTEAILGWLEGKLQPEDRFQDDCQRHVARWEVARQLRRLCVDPEVHVTLKHVFVRQVDHTSLRRHAAWVYRAIESAVDTFLNDVAVEMSPAGGSKVRYLFGGGVCKFPLLESVLTAKLLSLGHDVHPETPAQADTLIAQGAAIWNAIQGPVSRMNPPLPEEYPKTAEPMLKRKGAVKPVRWHVHASTAPSNTYSAEAVAVLAGLKPAAAGNGATLGAAMALGRSPMSRPVTAPVLASSPLAALRKGGGSSRNNLLPRPGSVNTGLGQARGGAGVGIGAGAGVGAFAGSPLGGYPSRPATPETNVTGAAAAGADATAEDGAELRAKFSATAKRSSRRKLTKLGTSMRSIRLVGVGSGESPVGNRTQRNFDLLGGRTMRTGTSQLQMVANLLDQDSSSTDEEMIPSEVESDTLSLSTADRSEAETVVAFSDSGSSAGGSRGRKRSGDATAEMQGNHNATLAAAGIVPAGQQQQQQGDGTGPDAAFQRKRQRNQRKRNKARERLLQAKQEAADANAEVGMSAGQRRLRQKQRDIEAKSNARRKARVKRGEDKLDFFGLDGDKKGGGSSSSRRKASRRRSRK